MRLDHKNLKEGTIRLTVENPDDLWYLSQIIEAGDEITSRTLRKIERGGEGEKKQVSRVPVVLSICAEKIEWAKSSPTLRILGTITQGPEDAPRSEHHSFSVEAGISLTIHKEHWPSYQLERVEESLAGEKGSVMLLLFDREEALFVLLKKYGYDLLTTFSGSVPKKESHHKADNTFYEDILKQLAHYDNRYKLTSIIIASPAFFKEDLLKELKDQSLKKKIILATIHSIGRNGIEEVLKRPEVKTALLSERAGKEMMLVDELLAVISRGGSAAYGKKEVSRAAQAGAVSHLLITDRLLMNMREKGESNALETLMKSVDQSSGNITIVSSDHEGGHKLDGLGGIGALLRYKL